MSDSICPVCAGAVATRDHVCGVAPYVGKKMQGLHCEQCGLIQFPANLGEFEKNLNRQSSVGQLRDARNAGDGRPGREYHMVRMAMEMLDRPAAKISFFGSGMNRDWQWVLNTYPQSSVNLVDLKNFQEVAHFEAIDRATPSDIVVASEVIEHFTEPLEHFRSLLRLVRNDGILICSTNVYDGSDMSQHMYPFIPGHVAYWTPLSLVKLAADSGFFVDFRTPQMGLTRGGPRKKYVLFYRQVEVFYRVSLYFGTHMHAPSEA